jgi:2-polyprenyl-3-methyl-5-hydroxy-6-metoxy-1,4-benzoquinol methylase
MKQGMCKICGGSSLTVFEHTAQCGDCGVLLYYPYPGDANTRPYDANYRDEALSWYSQSSFYNHTNFTNMIHFAMDETSKGRPLDVLDYGGGGGQFALVCKSLFPQATIYITDIIDELLLDEWRNVNIQIPFISFDHSQMKFNFIFLNDVFEHLINPLSVLKILANKLKDDGKIFIDTPKQFWIYPFAKSVSTSLYKKLLRGTVSPGHLQIWSRKSFEMVANESGLKIYKYKEVSEYTLPSDIYLKNMAITNPILKLAGRLFYANSKWLANNKILCVLAAA